VPFARYLYFVTERPGGTAESSTFIVQRGCGRTIIKGKYRERHGPPALPPNRVSRLRHPPALNFE
jgi:hypothetical protein